LFLSIVTMQEQAGMLFKNSWSTNLKFRSRLVRSEQRKPLYEKHN